MIGAGTNRIDGVEHALVGLTQFYFGLGIIEVYLSEAQQYLVIGG